MSKPLALTRASTIPSIGTLTIRRTSSGEATFFLIYRSIGQVATSEATYNVIPGGVFQPASLSPLGHRRDFDLWRNIMREFNEELLGAPEAKGDDGTEVDYAASPYCDFDRALTTGHLQIWTFGMGIQAHNLLPVLLTVAVFDADTFDELFANIVSHCDEGVLVSSPHGGVVSGLPLEREVVDDLLQSPRVSPIPTALLHLTLRHRDLLLGGTNTAASA